MAASPPSSDTAAIKPLSSPRNLTTIARELRQQILTEVFQEHIHNDMLESIMYCTWTKAKKRNHNPPSITKQAHDLAIALPNLKDDIVFVEQTARDSFHAVMELLSNVVSEVTRADRKRDIAGYLGCDTIEIYTRMGGELNLGGTGEENLRAMELWWRENMDSAVEKLQSKLAYYVHILKDGITCTHSPSCRCLKCHMAGFRDTHKRFCVLEQLVNGRFKAFDESVNQGNRNHWKRHSPHWTNKWELAFGF